MLKPLMEMMGPFTMIKNGKEIYVTHIKQSTNWHLEPILVLNNDDSLVFELNDEVEVKDV